MKYCLNFYADLGTILVNLVIPYLFPNTGNLKRLPIYRRRQVTSISILRPLII